MALVVLHIGNPGTGCDKELRPTGAASIAGSLYSVCDVIVDRWQRLTGSKATLDGDGRTFEEVAAERAKAV